MGFLDWMKSGNGSRAGSSSRNIFAPENQPVPPAGFSRRVLAVDSFAFTGRGNLVVPVAQTGWHSDHCGPYEFRQHIGRSIEGYHGGFQVSRSGDHGFVYWSNARPTQEGAEKASYAMNEAWHEGHECHWSKREAGRERHRDSSWER